MNRIVALPELAAITGRLAGVDADSASRFILAIFNAAADALALGETVSIKGIGRFRRVPSEAQIEFIPADELAEAVNAPFALFSPMELPADAPADLFGPESRIEEGSPTESETEPVAPATDEIPELSEPEPEHPQAEEPASAAADEKSDTEQEIPETKEPEVCETRPDNEPDDAPAILYVEKRSPWPWIAAIMCLLVGFAGGYCYGTHCDALRSGRDDSMSGVVGESAKTAEAIVADSITVDSVAASAPADTVKAALPVEEQPTKEPVYDTVTSTRFLTTIARAHYGRKDFWVFIYEANSDILRHPNRIRPGTRVLVPDLGPHAATDSATRARAHRLANEIYSRYDM